MIKLGKQALLSAQFVLYQQLQPFSYMPVSNAYCADQCSGEYIFMSLAGLEVCKFFVCIWLVLCCRGNGRGGGGREGGRGRGREGEGERGRGRGGGRGREGGREGGREREREGGREGEGEGERERERERERRCTYPRTQGTEDQSGTMFLFGKGEVWHNRAKIVKNNLWEWWS